MILDMFFRKETEQEKALAKREKWLRNSRRREAVAEFFGDLFFNVGEFFRKKADSIKDSRNRKQEEKARELEKQIKNNNESTSIEEYDLSKFQNLLNEFYSNKEKDEQLSIMDENLKIKAEASKMAKEENEKQKVTNLKINKPNMGEFLSKSGTFITTTAKKTVNGINDTLYSDDLPITDSKIKNLRIGKVLCGSLLTAGAAFILVKSNFSVTFATNAIVSLSLNVGLCNVVDGILLAKKIEKQKLKVFNNLDEIGEENGRTSTK